MRLLSLIILFAFQAVNAEKKPAEVLDLSRWKITMPFAGPDGKKPLEVKNPKLQTYSKPENFFVKDNTVIFRAHCTQISTKSSKYPRCELREMTKSGQKASWTTDDTRSMTAELAITAVPPVKKHVVCAQIHDAKDDVMMVRLEGKKLFIERNKLEEIYLDKNYVLGTKFNLRIESGSGQIKVFYNQELKMTWNVKVKGCYFKAGCYTQSNPSKGDKPESYGEVIYSKLDLK